jgi:Smr domain-containing protein
MHRMVWLLVIGLGIALFMWLLRIAPGASRSEGTAPPGGRLPQHTEGGEAAGPDPDYAVEIGDELDLHGVPPRDVDELVGAFVDVSLERGRSRVKIIHGKGTGSLRARVRVLLERHPGVAGYEDAVAPGSGWGATVVTLRPPPRARAASAEVAPRTPGV